MENETDQIELRKIIEPTWEMCFKIWWSWFWRSALLGAVVGLIVGVSVEFIAQLFGAEPGKFGAVLGSLAWVLMGILAFKKVLKLKFSNFRIALVSRR